MPKKPAKRVIHKMVAQYPVIVQEEAKGGYWVSCPAFEGCYSQGETIEQALENIREAIFLCREEQREVSQRKPTNVSLHLVRV